MTGLRRQLALTALAAAAAGILAGLALIFVARWTRPPAAPWVVAPAAAAETVLTELAAELGPITRIRLTPDRRTLLVANLNGRVHAFRRDSAGRYVRQPQPFFDLPLNLRDPGPGQPPRENGLTGLAFAADFATSGDIFLLHVRRGEDNWDRNLVTRVQWRTDAAGNAVGVDPVVIFTGNFPPERSHQIQGGAGVIAAGRPGLLFSVGDATQADKARQPLVEAGKLLLIDREGLPLGSPAPFGENPKVRAIGLRNAYDLVPVPGDDQGRILLVDTGPESNDRLVIAAFAGAGPDGRPAGIDLNWDGRSESLAAPVTAPGGGRNLVVHLFNPSVTPADLRFCPAAGGHPGGGGLGFVLNLWGTYDGKLGRSVQRGNLTPDGEGGFRVTMADFVVRGDRATPGAPLGLECDPETGTVWFGDVHSGRLYELRRR